MNTFDETVAQHLAALHGADRENAYHRLIELGPGVIPLLTTRFQQERDPIMRSTLVNIAWRAHASSAVPLLQEAVEDAEPRIWKEALDGLVAVGGSDALDAMRQARERAKGEKAAWLDEAIDQIRA